MAFKFITIILGFAYFSSILSPLYQSINRDSRGIIGNLFPFPHKTLFRWSLIYDSSKIWRSLNNFKLSAII